MKIPNCLTGVVVVAGEEEVGGGGGGERRKSELVRSIACSKAREVPLHPLANLSKISSFCLRVSTAFLRLAVSRGMIAK